MRANLHKILALTRKDFLITFSYRMEFLMRIAGIFFTVLLWHFLSKVINPTYPDYYRFVIVGIAFQAFLTTHLYGTASRIRDEQVTGTLESVLATPTPPSFLLLGGMLSDFINALANVLIMMVLASLVGDFTLQTGSITGILLSIVLTAAAFASIGCLSASVVILFQKGNPFNFLITTMQALLGTVFFPVEILPGWLQGVAAWMPMTRSLQAVRGSLLHGKGLMEIAPHLCYLLIFSILFFSLGTWLFKASIQKARSEGSLGRF